MDTLRGNFDGGIAADDSQDFDADDPGERASAEMARELPPEAIGQDERRMQVRAYNHWASQLGDAPLPSIEDLEPHNLEDFGPNSVLLDFSAGIDDPLVQYLGGRLGQECGGGLDADGAPIQRLSDVPPRSLLSRITDHYMQILANQAPIGFEAEFVNQRGVSILYRGILLPYSSDGEMIDFIYGVINWKEMADAATADELLREIDQALSTESEEPVEDEDEPQKHHADTLTEWEDSPSHEVEGSLSQMEHGAAQDLDGEPVNESMSDNVAGFVPVSDGTGEEESLPIPDFGQYGLDEPEVDEFGQEIDDGEAEGSGYSFASLSDYIEAPIKKAVDLDADRFDPEDYKVETPHAPTERLITENQAPLELGAEDALDDDVLELSASAQVDGDDNASSSLYDCLASARELAQTARVSEDRSRKALYAAVGRAYDVSLAAGDNPDDYAELIKDNGLAVQERAPMTPIVKLVFGHDYDKTRLTEYAAVLAHAHRLNLERGSLGSYLGSVEGGLKGVVASERRLRREEAGQTVEDEGDVRAKLAKKLRELDEILFEALEGDGPEFSLVMLRRDPQGKIALIGEIADDVSLIERAGKKLIG